MDWVFIAFGLVCFFAGYQVQNLFELILDKKQFTQEEWEEEQKSNKEKVAQWREEQKRRGDL